MFHIRPPERSLIPRWDLPLVLRFLASPEFSALHKLSLLELSQRTAFLLAVACGRRCSEIHALSIRPEYLEINESGAILLPRAGFLVKNQTIHFTPDPIFLPDLRKATLDPRDVAWCPVQCLKFYLARTKPLRKGIDQLFITSKLPHRPLSRTSLSRWIVTVVNCAYLKYGRPMPLGPFILGTGRGDIASAGWQTQTTFQRVYLKDVFIRNRGRSRMAVVALGSRSKPGGQ